MTSAAAIFGRPTQGTFPARHPWDAAAVLVLVATIWLAVLGGFIPDMVDHVRSHKPAYPLIVHVHAVVFMGWLVLLTCQTALVRTGNVAIHRKLGVLGAGNALAILVLGPATAIVVALEKWGTPASDPAFLSIQFTDIAAFAGPVAAAILLRRDAAAHKRLILLATLYITDAGFGRMFAIFFPGLGGTGWWGFYVDGSLQPDLLILLIGAYDLVTRKRLHPVYLPAVAWMLLMQVSSIVLYYNSSWRAFAPHLLGH